MSTEARTSRCRISLAIQRNDGTPTFVQVYHIYTAFIPHLYHGYITFIPHSYHIYTILIPHFYHIYITFILLNFDFTTPSPRPKFGRKPPDFFARCSVVKRTPPSVECTPPVLLVRFDLQLGK